MKPLSLLSFISIVSAGGISPISDADLFSIHWAGSADLETLTNVDLEVVTVQTEENERYKCIIPESQASIDATRKATYNGATPDELMEALFSQSSCSYRIESYWTYELCHGKHIKQYHDNKELGQQKPKLQEYYLGQIKPAAAKQDIKQAIGDKTTPDETAKDKTTLDETVKDKTTPDETVKDKIEPGETIEDETKAGKTAPDETTQDEIEEEKDVEIEPEVKKAKSPQEIRSVKIDGLDLPYFSVNMSDGTVCDLTGQSRHSHIKYICQPNGRGEIYQLKETSSCEYDIIVLTAVLCSHPSFKPKDPPVSKIHCHPVGASPQQPRRLTDLLNEQGIILEPEEEVTPPPQQTTPIMHKVRVPQPVSTQRVDTTIGKEADKQLLRDFLNGDYCIHGGGGWWKHEFCYNKYAKQYHEETGSVTTIHLGHWDKSKHLAWLEKHPTKVPKAVGSRNSISLFYSGGDVCDLTNAPRFVEVKLKCLNNPQQPHAVSIYLVEPTPCEYVLGVESPLFCNLLDQADNTGLFDHVEV